MSKILVIGYAEMFQKFQQASFKFHDIVYKKNDDKTLPKKLAMEMKQIESYDYKNIRERFAIEALSFKYQEV